MLIILSQVPDQTCDTVEDTECELVPKQDCHAVTEIECETTPREVGKGPKVKLLVAVGLGFDNIIHVYRYVSNPSFTTV